MIIPKDLFPSKTNTPGASYPEGQARNVTTSGDATGTPLDQAWLNDWFGFQQAAMAAAGHTPSGSADTALNSQLLIALQSLIAAATPSLDTLLAEFDLTNGGANDLAFGRIAHDPAWNGIPLVMEVVDVEFSTQGKCGFAILSGESPDIYPVVHLGGASTGQYFSNFNNNAESGPLSDPMVQRVAIGGSQGGPVSVAGLGGIAWDHNNNNALDIQNAGVPGVHALTAAWGNATSAGGGACGMRPMTRAAYEFRCQSGTFTSGKLRIRRA